jgi:ElaB/YqjD/DUF883 family membrane-anchored ribosome-binding protein
MSTSFEAESNKSPETLEREIDAKRASISNLVDSLESRFTPGQLFDQALTYTKGNGGEFFQNLGTTIKNNPLPTVLTGVGLAWLAINQNKPFSPGAPSTGPGLGERLSSAVGQVTGAFAQAGDRLHSASDTALDKGQALRDKGQSLKDKASDWTHRTGDSLDSTASNLRDSLDSTASNLRDSAHQASDRLQAQAGQLKGQFDQVLKDQPLIIAAIGVALGAVLGAALPSTRKEDELMGGTRDDLAAKLKSKGEEVYAVAKDTVKQAGETAKEAVKPDAGKPDTAASETTPAKPAQSPTDLSAGLGIQP